MFFPGFRIPEGSSLLLSPCTFCPCHHHPSSSLPSSCSSSLSSPCPCLCFIVVPVPVAIVLSWSWPSLSSSVILLPLLVCRSSVWQVLGQLHHQQFHLNRVVNNKVMEWKGKKFTNGPKMLFDISWAFYSFALPPSHCLPDISHPFIVLSGLVAEFLFSCCFVVGCILTLQAVSHSGG